MKSNRSGMRQPRQKLPDIMKRGAIDKSKSPMMNQGGGHGSSPMMFKSDPVMFSPPAPPLIHKSESLRKLTDQYGGGDILNRQKINNKTKQQQQLNYTNRQQENVSTASLISSLSPLGNGVNSSVNGGGHHKLGNSCLTCAEDISGRCSFCLREKSSMAPRMKLHDVGKRIIDEHPTIQAEKLLNMIYDYGRSSNYAFDLNNRLSYGGDGITKPCDLHIDSLSDLGLKAEKYEKEVEILLNKLNLETNYKKEIKTKLEFATIAIEKIANNSDNIELRLKENELMFYEDKKESNNIINILKNKNFQYLEKIKILEQKIGLSIPGQNNENDNEELKCESCLRANKALKDLKTRWAEFLDSIEEERKEREKELRELRKQIDKDRDDDDDDDCDGEASPKRRSSILSMITIDRATQTEDLEMKTLEVTNESEVLKEEEIEEDKEKNNKPTETPKVPLDLTLMKNKRLCPFGKYLGIAGQKKYKKSKVLTLQQCLNIIHEVYEKKCFADIEDKRAGTVADSMVEFIEEHFLFKYGLQKIASQRLDEFLFSCLKYLEKHIRIENFLKQIGMVDIRYYHRGIGDFMSHLIAKSFGETPERLGRISERLGSDSENKKTLISASSIITTFLGDDADLYDESTWHQILPCLSSIASKKQIFHFIKDKLLLELKIYNITSLEAAEEMGQQKKKEENDHLSMKKKKIIIDDYKRIVFDEFMKLSLSFLFELSKNIQLKLELFFQDYDDDIPGLEFHEFKELVIKEIGRQDLSSDQHKLAKIWKKLVLRAGNDKEEGGLIEDSSLFSIACFQCDLIPEPPS